MEIRLYNIGPIKEFKFDLNKDLTVIFGKNNVGKSYAITIVYLIVKKLLSLNGNQYKAPFRERYFMSFETSANQSINNKLINELSRLSDSREKTAIISHLVVAAVKKNLEAGFIRALEESLINSFISISSILNKYSQENLEIEIDSANLTFKIGVNDKNHLVVKSISLKKEVLVRFVKVNRENKYEKERITYYVNTTESEPYGFLLYSASNYFEMLLYREVIDDANQVYFMPASRSGLYQALSTFSAVIAELSKSRSFLTRKIELPNISEPVSDYFLNLSSIATNRKRSTLQSIAAKIEDDILGGEVRINKETNKIVFRPSNIKVELDLSVVSSMISEIAPIVAYLKYVVTDNRYKGPAHIKKDFKESAALIFIEEPEAHLHPEVQVRIMEFFTLLIKRRVKIVMTTHSNYMFNKLSNLILDKQVSYERVGSYLMRMTKEGSMLDEISMQAGEFGITDENFSDIAERLYNERLATYDKINKENAN